MCGILYLGYHVLLWYGVSMVCWEITTPRVPYIHPCGLHTTPGMGAWYPMPRVHMYMHGGTPWYGVLQVLLQQVRPLYYYYMCCAHLLGTLQLVIPRDSISCG